MKITGWRYGIIHHLNSKGDYFAIHKIYRDGEQIGWSLEPVKIIADDPCEIHSEVALIGRDIQLHDVIVVDDATNTEVKQ